MLRIYYGRENIDKDKFMFDRIGQALPESKRIILMVPDQFTLQAERNAFDCLGVDGLMDLEILSQTRLGTRVLAETGGSSRVHIDKYGRHMLLSKIIAGEDDTLEAFRGMKKAASFIELVNDLIIELKQFNIHPSALPEIIEKTEPTSLLHRKLVDVLRIYTRYEEQISGKYMDTEDYMSLFVSAVKRSQMVREAELWIAGFDTFTPKSELLIEQLMRCAQNVNIVLTADEKGRDRSSAKGGAGEQLAQAPDRDLFYLAFRVMSRLSFIAAQNGIDWVEEEIGEEYRIGTERKTPELIYLEQTLYAFPYQEFMPADEKSCCEDSIHFCRSANFYAEAETVAAAICGLVRTKGLRYRDIAVICNDMEGRGSVIKRVFEEYGIPSFADQKRKVIHHPAVEFVTALLDIVIGGWRYEDVFRFLKTGLTGMRPEEWEDLENYAIKYRIRGSKWKKEFQYGVNDEGEEKLEELNRLRCQLTKLLEQFEKEFRKEKTARGKTCCLYEFLCDRADLPQHLEDLIERLANLGEYEAAEESAQVWGVIISLLDQLVELLGDEKLTSDEFSDMLQAGFEAVEVGLIPPTMDQVILGTMQRTRTGAIKAMFVVGANDGLLPMGGVSEDLLSEDEKAVLRENNIEICKDDELRVGEERLAIYRNLSKPSEYLWLGCAAADLDGRELRPSMIYDKLRKMFPYVREEKDLINRALEGKRDDLLIERPVEALSHLTEAVRACREGAGLSNWWRASYNWMKRFKDGELGVRTPSLRPVKAGLLFENRQEKLERELAEKIYKREGFEVFTISPSRLERFSRCPFAHFVQYGLKPEERRIFEVASREAGDVYHECLMRLSEELTIPGMEITAEESPWMRLGQSECEQRVEALIEQVSKEYREGMLSQGEEEQYRAARMKEVCASAAWALVSHVQQGKIREVFFEAPFGGRTRAFPPIRVEAGGQTVLIEGKIDRVDVLSEGVQASADGNSSQETPETAFIKIIDYKSGKERFDISEARGGWRLQLMIYLKAAMEGVAGRPWGRKAEVKPAGVFYFEIAEPMIDASEMDTEEEELEEYRAKLKAEIQRGFKLDGILLDDSFVINGIAGDLAEAESGFSRIAPVKKMKNGNYSGTSDQKLLSEEQFSELREAVDQTVERLCEELVSGRLELSPKKTKYETACRFCQYRSICNFDLAFEGCRYERI